MAAVISVTVTARRWEHGWELDVKDVGVTQTRSLALADRDASDYVELMTGSRPEHVTVSWDLGQMEQEIAGLRAARVMADEAQDHAADLARQVVSDLRHMGMSGDDIGKVLDVSPQRVSQLSDRGSQRSSRRISSEVAAKSAPSRSTLNATRSRQNVSASNSKRAAAKPERNASATGKSSAQSASSRRQTK
jgi:hypothetical protein